MTIDGTRHSKEALQDERLNTGSDKIYQNYMMPALELYDAKVSINHWQLRDCIKPGSMNQSKLYYIYDHSIRVLDTDSLALRSPVRRHHSIQPRNSSRTSISKASTKGAGTNSSFISKNLHVPSEKLVEFNFKPRCFTELNGLTVCGGLIGSDDKGFPSNWNRLSQNANVSLPPPSQPINISKNISFPINSHYSNPNIWKGIVEFYNQESDTMMTFTLGQFINNCVTLYDRATTQFDLFACNNDGHLYQCDVSNRDVTLVKRYADLKFPLNNASLSHDGQTMVVSGDSNKFAVYNQNELTNQFSLHYDNHPSWGSSSHHIRRIPRFALPDESEYIENIYEAPNSDHGFYNCFSENDLQFATVFQNGSCSVYDVRNMATPMAEISSTRPHSHNGAFRVCRFSYGLDDLLFISEHQGRVHVVDTRNFVNHQVIVIPDKVNMEYINEQRHNSNSRFNMNNGNDNDGNNNGKNDSQLSQGTDYHSLARRRFSLPSLPNAATEPWITMAQRIPKRYLEPQILPFPKVMDKISNESVLFSPACNPSNDTSHRNKRRCSFRIRRVSTSTPTVDPAIAQFAVNPGSTTIDSNATSSSNSAPRNLIDPLILSHQQMQDDVFEDDEYYETYNDVHSTYRVSSEYPDLSPRAFESFLRPPSTPDLPPDDDNFATNNRNNRGTSNFLRRAVISTQENSEFLEENNISGINWVEDRNGSSLVIGTDYGIMRWNINSWARRSFSSYDLC
ncbi:YLR149C [Saccharomyces arboricola H-6]|uniref:YLR149C n=1 Tax=Saccharomyces arboricola (strain H-6 / AS 2.3317 / CBS 10644) TaxID=1160507 RepID=J8Q231_SACAR|nr:YLR149C [Saccharomyces arboricola H-6]